MLESGRKPIQEIVAVAHLYRHPDTIFTLNPETGERSVGVPYASLHPDAGNQYISVLTEASDRLQAMQIFPQDPERAKPALHYDKLVSTPAIRGQEAGNILYTKIPVTNNNREPATQDEYDALVARRKREKREPLGLDKFTDAYLWEVSQSGKPYREYIKLLCLDIELRKELETMAWGLITDDRLTNPFDRDADYVGLNSHDYSKMLEERKIPPDLFWKLKNAFDNLIRPDSALKSQPMLVGAIMHGTCAIVLENLIHYRGQEEKIANMTYGEQKRLGQSLPHGSVVEVVIYQDESMETRRIIAPTHEKRRGKEAGGTSVQPPPPTYPTLHQLHTVWRRG